MNDELTWQQAIDIFTERAESSIKDASIDNMLIITTSGADFSYGIVDYQRLRDLIGSLECVKAHLIKRLIDGVDTEDDDLYGDYY